MYLHIFDDVNTKQVCQFQTSVFISLKYIYQMFVLQVTVLTSGNF